MRTIKACNMLNAVATLGIIGCAMLLLPYLPAAVPAPRPVVHFVGSLIGLTFGMQAASVVYRVLVRRGRRT